MTLPQKTQLWAGEMKRRLGWILAVKAGKKLPGLEDMMKEIDVPALGKIRTIDWEKVSKDFSDLDDHSVQFADRRRVAEALYHELHHRYGFEQALHLGLYSLWPHELLDATCASQALANYAVAKECGLNPQILEFTGFRKRGDRFSGGHSFILTDVGEKDPWIIDQSYRILGPAEFDTQSLRVRNRARGKEKEEEYEYLVRDIYSEDEYTQRMEYQRSPAGAASMLVGGQRLGFPEFDRWKSKKPVPTMAWFVAYDPDSRTLSTLVGIDRPLIQKRGLESRTVLTPAGGIVEDRIIGYFFSQQGWVSFLDSIPIISLPVAEISPLLKGLSDLGVPDQLEFETYAMAAMEKPEDDCMKALAKAARESYRTMQTTRFGIGVRKIALAEALYQQARGQAPFVFSERTREHALTSMGDDPNIADLLRAQQYLARHKKTQRRIEHGQANIRYQRRGGRVHMLVLEPLRREDPAVQEFLSAEGPVEKLAQMLRDKPLFYDEAVDRVLFARRQLAPYASSLSSLEAHATTIFGSNISLATEKGYARIFAEFLGHAANAWPHLRLEEHRNDILKKVREYRP